MERDPMGMALSNDIVMDIVLSHLKVIDLLSCRLTSKFWNRAACSVLTKRSTMIKNISDETCLMELEECMEKNLDFPFAGLKLDKPWTLNSGRATEFFENYGTRFTRLCVNTHCTRRLDVLVPFIHHFSRLTILEMALPHSRPPHPPLKFTDSGAGLEGDILNLSSLRILRIFCPYVAEKVLGQVLLVTSPLIKIECLSATRKTLKALKKAEKLGAVAFIKFEDYDSEYYQPKLDQLLPTESTRLTKLDFSHKGCLSLVGLQNILFSSRRTLNELHLDVAFMGRELKDVWNNFPVLAKLTKLSLHVEMSECLEYLFQGRHGHNFPALKELKLVCAGYLPSRNLEENLAGGLFIVPSVTRIDLQGYYSEHTTKQLAQVFPNVTDIRLNYEYYSLPDPFKTWSVVGPFKYLERLRICNYKVEQSSENPISMDSFLTGMSAGICNNLRKHEKLNLIDSPWNELSRENPSILQLKKLKELVVCLELEDGLEEVPEDPPFMSMVSVWYAVEMIPSLRVKFTYEVSLPRSSDEDHDKAVLEAALEYVRPYVTLEPFFY